MNAGERRAVQTASLINGILVASIPLWPLAFATDTAVRPAEAAAPSLLMYPPLFAVFLTLGLLAGWRTYVHARSYVEGRSRGWAAILEPALVGFGVALWTLRNGIRSHPFDAPPYIIGYGGGAFVLGMVMGLILRLTAIVTLRLIQGTHKTRTTRAV